MNNRTILTPFYVTKKEAVNSKSKKKNEVYLKCISVCFLSCRLNGFEGDTIILTNKDINVDGYGFENIAAQKIEYKENLIADKIKNANNFPGCLFLIDALEWGKKNPTGILYTDSDVLFRNSFETVFTECDKGEMPAAYPVEYSLEKKVNGISRKDLQEIFYNLHKTKKI